MEKDIISIVIPKTITDLTDAEFLSFLYSERDREGRLSRWQGWNNWALVGAFVAVMWTTYSIWKEHCYVRGYDVIYYTSGIMSIFLSICLWINLFKKERGIDISRLRWLKEVYPYHLTLIALGCSFTFSLLIAAKDGYCNLFWLWSILGFFFVITLVSLICYRNRIMPVYADECMFPCVKVNMLYYCVVGLLYGPIVTQSFKKVLSSFLSNEFEIAACISAGIVIADIFIKLNTGEKIINKLDVIIDDYIYNGVARDVTTHEIVKNRMGYSVMDVCYKDLTELYDMMIECEKDYKRIDAIKETVEGGECIVIQLKNLQKESENFNKRLKKMMKKFRKLMDKLNAALHVSFGRKTIAAINVIQDEIKKAIDRIGVMEDKVQETVSVVQKRIDELKVAGVCEQKCEG